MTRVAIIGVGLIGGSLGMSLRRSGWAREVVGCGRTVANLETARRRGAIDRFTQDPASAVTEADLVVVGVPVGAVEGVLRAVAPSLRPEAVVTDVGSVKGTVVEAAGEALSWPGRFVGGHPIAGTENRGAEAADPDLFVDARWILTPGPGTDPDARELVHAMAEATGARVEVLEPTEHDRILAWVSHLPHLIAYGLADALHRADPALISYGGGGLRDFLRVAASDAEMWRDIFAANHEAVDRALEGFERAAEDLSALAERPEELVGRLDAVRDRIRAFREGEQP